jgi:hypothetical protein
MAKIMFATLSAAVAAQEWSTLTLYDVLEETCRTDVADKDLGDPAGDAFFNVKDKYLPYACSACKAQGTCHHHSSTFDCDNPESSGNLVVRKVEVEVKRLDWKNYELCNVKEGTCSYKCQSMQHHLLDVGVGATPVCGSCFMAPPAGVDPHYHYNATDPWDYWLCLQRESNSQSPGPHALCCWLPSQRGPGY